MKVNGLSPSPRTLGKKGENWEKKYIGSFLFSFITIRGRHCFIPRGSCFWVDITAILSDGVPVSCFLNSYEGYISTSRSADYRNTVRDERRKEEEKLASSICWTFLKMRLHVIITDEI